MDASVAVAITDRICTTPARTLALEFRGDDPLAHTDVVRLVIDRARALTVGRALTFSMVTHLGALTPAVCDWLVDTAITVTVPLHPLPDAHEADRARTGAPTYTVSVRALQDLHARFAARGISPEGAYVTVASAVNPETLAAGPEAFVAAALRLGAPYARWLPVGVAPEVYRDFYREALDRVLDANLQGTLLVEKCLALHLEVIAAARGLQRPALEAPAVVHTPDGAEHIAVTDPPRGCHTCPYDPYCARGILPWYTQDTPDRHRGTAWCQRSTATFDTVSALLRDGSGTRVRRVFQRWCAARDVAAARFSSVTARG